MKWIYAIAAVALFAASAVRATEVEEDEEGDARLGFITVNSDGTTSLTFNATSIQNAVILGLFIIILGALLVPLFGGALGGTGGGTGYGYGGGAEQSGYASGGAYEQPAASGYTKRSAEFLGPVLDALSSAYKKYDDEEEK
jgi:hypothetical protein